MIAGVSRIDRRQTMTDARAVGTALLATIVTKREQFHSNIIGQSVHLGREEVRARIEQMTNFFLAHGGSTDVRFTQSDEIPLRAGKNGLPDENTGLFGNRTLALTRPVGAASLRVRLAHSFPHSLSRIILHRHKRKVPASRGACVLIARILFSLHINASLELEN
jgi:hypothetical protein